MYQLLLTTVMNSVGLLIGFVIIAGEFIYWLIKNGKDD